MRGAKCAPLLLPQAAQRSAGDSHWGVDVAAAASEAAAAAAHVAAVARADAARATRAAAAAAARRAEVARAGARSIVERAAALDAAASAARDAYIADFRRGRTRGTYMRVGRRSDAQ